MYPLPYIFIITTDIMLIHLYIECSNCDNYIKFIYTGIKSKEYLVSMALNQGWSFLDSRNLCPIHKEREI